VLGEQALGGLEDAGTVAGGVRALARGRQEAGRGRDDRQRLQRQRRGGGRFTPTRLK
jgi:hypothetical protein